MNDLYPEAEVEEIDVRKVLIMEALSWLKIIIFAIVFAFVLTRFVIVNASVPTGSMEGTIRSNDRIVAFRLSYIFSTPDMYDIIVFYGPDGDDMLYVKRVVGLPGDTLVIINGDVFLNDSPVPIRSDFVHGSSFGNYGPYEIPEGHVFVLGDNRGNSVDSRSWENTFVRKDQILGRVLFRYFPNFRNLTNS